MESNGRALSFHYSIISAVRGRATGISASKTDGQVDFGAFVPAFISHFSVTAGSKHAFEMP